MINKSIYFLSASLLISLGIMGNSYSVSAQGADVFSEMIKAFPILGLQIPTQEFAQRVIKEGEQLAKKSSNEVEQKISQEHSKQTDIVGGRPQSGGGGSGGGISIGGGGGGSSGSGKRVDNCPAIMAQHQYASNKAFEFTEEYLSSNDLSHTYGPATNSFADAVEFIKYAYYVEDAHDDQPSTNTPENINNTLIARDGYLQVVNSQVMALGLGIQQSLIADAQSISPSPTSGCNLIDDLNINTLTVIATARQTMANIALQIKMLELDAVKRLKETRVLLEKQPTPQTPSDE